MTLLTDIDAFDGRHMDELERLLADRSPEPGFVGALLRLAADPAPLRQVAATWLLKRRQEDGHAFTDDESAALLDWLAAADTATPWEARLHLLQMLPGLAIPAGRAAALRVLLAGPAYLGDANKFLRAWSYNALAVLAAQHPDYRQDVAELLTDGRDDAASVRARLRQIFKTHPWADSAGRER
ncbi:MAG: hypothetical protein QNJ94_23600 [Alphaproteobacteria bacterium]|nr:hypothetical protein [Alphaproteobacteria bacterium]